MRRGDKASVPIPSTEAARAADRPTSILVTHNQVCHPRGGKVLGAIVHRQYVEVLRDKGIDLVEETGLQKRSSLLTKKGNRVIILVANRELDVGQWFLGVHEEFVMEKPGTFLIFVCKDGDRLFDFVIPPNRVTSLIKEVRDVPSMPGAKKFSIFRSNGTFKLRKQGGGTIDLDDYLGNYDELQRVAA